MNIDCSIYENCPKNLTQNYTNKSINPEKLSLVFFGCWGTYCKSLKDSYIKRKYKKGKFSSEEVEYGEAEMASLLAKYSNETDVDAVILAGDNVYENYPIKNQTEDFDKELEKFAKNDISEKQFKNFSYDMEKQLKVGFEYCLKNVKTSTFLLGIGNHDVETCDILNKQINYKGWKMPALSYNYLYKVNDNCKVNLVFIDTNIYDEIYCDEQKYELDARSKQKEWLNNVLTQNKDCWNLVIGHIPFIYNPHKEGKKGIRRELYEDIQENKHLIDLYMCADEHNSQYIIYKDMPPEIISGIGGAILDKNIYINELKDYTLFTRAVFGFVGLEIYNQKIILNFYSTENPEDFKTFQINKKNI